jgi:hypothetical protein
MLADHVYSCKYGNFMFDSEKARLDCFKKYTVANIWSDIHAQKETFKNAKYAPQRSLLIPSTTWKNIKYGEYVSCTRSHHDRVRYGGQFCHAFLLDYGKATLHGLTRHLCRLCRRCNFIRKYVHRGHIGFCPNQGYDDEDDMQEYFYLYHYADIVLK